VCAIGGRDVVFTSCCGWWESTLRGVVWKDWRSPDWETRAYIVLEVYQLLQLIFSEGS
jgi:hypothetical protein